MRTIATLLLLILPIVTVDAQNQPADPAQEIRRYTVEMIVFKYAEDIGGGGELFVGDPPATAAYTDARMSDEANETPQRMLRLPNSGLTRLPRGDFKMGDIMGRLQRLRAYEPVMHFGWTQSTFPEDLTRDIALSSLTTPRAGFDGSFKLYLSRFLHLVVDLQLDAVGSSAVDSLEPVGPVRFRITEDRIFRSGELRYFDHPKFGVLAKVTRVEEDAEQPGELLGDSVQ
jgi:hypothetical protein